MENKMNNELIERAREEMLDRAREYGRVKLGTDYEHQVAFEVNIWIRSLMADFTEQELARAKSSDKCELHKKLEACVVILTRCENAWCGGKQDDGLMDDISTLRNQIRKMLTPITPDQTFEIEADSQPISEITGK